MTTPATTRLSSRGQVVIPEAVRRQLGLAPGAEFVVVGKGDAIVLQLVRAPDVSEFRELLAKARRQARAAGLKRSDITKAVREVRDPQ